MSTGYPGMFFTQKIIMEEKLHTALSDPKWLNHEIGDLYTLINRGGGRSEGWKIAYYPIFQSLKSGKWTELEEARVLIEKPITEGIDFREVPFRYLEKQIL